MSTTTALELLEHADLLTREHRLLRELIGTDAANVRTADPSWHALHLAIRSYPTPLRPPVDEPQHRAGGQSLRA